MGAATLGLTVAGAIDTIGVTLGDGVAASPGVLEADGADADVVRAEGDEDPEASGEATSPTAGAEAEADADAEAEGADGSLGGEPDGASPRSAPGRHPIDAVRSTVTRSCGFDGRPTDTTPFRPGRLRV